MRELQLKVITLKGKINREINVDSLFLAGYTGRDQEEVKSHVNELEKMGVLTPQKTPAFYNVNPDLLTNKEEIVVKTETTSGEIEYVLLIGKDQTYVTVGSDHTDRLLERISIQRAKETCAKVTAKEVWPIGELNDHWDDIVLRAKVLKDGSWKTYQEGKLKSLLNPEDLLNALDFKTCGFVCTVLFSGTISLKVKQAIYADEFEMEIYDPELRRRISHKYRVRRTYETKQV